MTPSDLLRKRIILNNSKSLRTNIGGIFHIFKNNYFSLYCKCISIQEKLPEEYRGELTPLIENIQTMQDNLRKLSSSINRIHLNPSTVKVPELLESTIKTIAPGNIKIEYDSECDSCIIGDFIYLSEAMVNILNNSVEAIKATKQECGTITIKTSQDTEFVSISISDNGIGMDKQTKAKILKPQFSTKSSSSNWGLGLTFSFRVITAHLGFMNIESKEGKGTTIELLLPFQGTVQNEY
jgi:signal transduction histidine kinase